MCHGISYLILNRSPLPALNHITTTTEPSCFSQYENTKTEPMNEMFKMEMSSKDSNFQR